MVNHVKWLVQCLVCLPMHSMHSILSIRCMAWPGASQRALASLWPQQPLQEVELPSTTVPGTQFQGAFINGINIICGSAFPTLYLLPSNSQSYNKLVAKKKSLHSATTTMATAFSLQRLFHLFCSWHDAPEDDKEYECFCIGLCKAEQS